MPNFMDALAQGGGPPGGMPPPDAGGGDPYGGAPPDQGMTPIDEAPPEPDAGAAGEGGFETSLDALDAAEEALHAFIKLDPDEADRAVAARCLQEVLKLKAANQQSEQSGGLKSLQRALQGAG